MSQRFESAGSELIENADEARSGVRPVLLRPVASVRSPILEHRPLERSAWTPDRSYLVVPPLGVLVGPVIWVIVPAIVVLVQVGWQPALVVGVFLIVVRWFGRLVGLSSTSFGEGFLPYRADDGWPHGVQEEDEVHWNWSLGGDVGAAGRPSREGSGG